MKEETRDKNYHEVHLKAVKAYQLRHREAGLCMQCNNKAMLGKTACIICARKRCENSRRWISANKERQRKSMASWRRKHPEYMKNWAEKHPGYGKNRSERARALAEKGPVS